MKLYIAAGFAALLSMGCSPAPWTRADTARQVTTITLQAIDWSQTRRVASSPERWREKNPLLGDHPSTNSVDMYFAAGLTANSLIAYYLPKGWREPFQYISIGFNGAFVVHNLDKGIHP